MAIMVDLNQGWRMAGDTSAVARPGRGPRDRGRGSPSYDVLWLEEPLAGTDLRGLAALRASAPGVRIAGGEMTRTFDELLAALDADAFDVHQPDVVLAAGMLRGADDRRARPGPEPLVHAAHLDQRDRAAGEPRTSRPASAAARSSSSRTTRPAGPPSGATSCSPSRSGPDADGVLRVPTAPGLGIEPRRGRRCARYAA